MSNNTAMTSLETFIERLQRCLRFHVLASRSPQAFAQDIHLLGFVRLSLYRQAEVHGQCHFPPRHSLSNVDATAAMQELQEVAQLSRLFNWVSRLRLRMLRTQFSIIKYLTWWKQQRPTRTRFIKWLWSCSSRPSILHDGPNDTRYSPTMPVLAPPNDSCLEGWKNLPRCAKAFVLQVIHTRIRSHAANGGRILLTNWYSS